MAQELTREEFVQIFGMSPEQYEQRNPTKVHALGQPAAPRRYKQEQPPVNNEKAYELSPERSAQIDKQTEAFVNTSVNNQTDPAVRRYVEQFVRDRSGVQKETAKHGEQLVKNVASGIMQTPTDVAGFVDLVRFGVPALAAGLSDNDPNKGRFGEIGDAFMDSVFPAEVQADLQNRVNEIAQQFMRENPKASAEDARKFIDKYRDSDEFFAEITKRLPAGFSIATAGNQFANKVVGLGKRPDQQTIVDELEQVLGQSIIGLPRAFVNQIKDAAIKRLGEKVVNNVVTKIGTRVAEAATPLTLPLTPANVAVNAGVGAVMTEGARYLQEAPTLIDYENLYDPENLPEPETVGAATGLSAGALFGLPAITRGVRRQADQAAQSAVDKLSINAGPSLEQQAQEMPRNLSPLTGLVDQNSPAKHAAHKFKEVDDTETVPQIDAALSAASTVNRVEAENNALNYGILHGLENTVPFIEVDRALRQLDAPSQELFDKYVYAVQRKQDSALYEQSLIKQVRDAQTDLSAANLSGHRGRIKAAQENLVKVQQKYTALQQDDVSSRSSMQAWTRSDVDAIIAAGEANPAIKKIGDAYRKISQDLVDFEHKNGLISAEEAARRKQTRPLFVHLQEKAHAGASGLKRKALLFKDKFRRADSDQEFFINASPRNVTGEGGKVNQPKSAAIALQETIMNSVRNVTVNNARREVIDRLDALPNARGNLLKPYEFNLGNGRKSHSISESQFATVFKGEIPNRDKYVKISRNGNIEFWQFSDPSLTKSLQFAPLATVPIMNETRKIWQMMTTGLGAPWFAARTFLWDTPLAKTTLKKGRSLGLIDTYARRLAQGTQLEGAVDFLGDHIFDPTAFASAGIAIPYQLGLRAARAVGVKVASDLANNSGVFATIANSGPRGQAFVEGIGTSMATAFDQSAFAVMSKNLSTSLSHLNDANKILDDFRGVASNKRGVLATLGNSYKAMIESVQMATKTAFFAENYGRLKAKHNGNIPAGELRKLVQETRNLTGDMSRQSNSKYIQGLTSVIPYSNAIFQGTRHILSAAVPEPVAKAVNLAGGNMLTDRQSKFWSQFLSGVLLPQLGALAFLANWEGAEDYWYNRTPKWQQLSGIPIPSAQTITEAIETGQMPKFHPSKMNIVPLSPEFALISGPVIAGMRAMGILGSSQYKVPTQFGAQLKDVMNQVTSFAMPPLIKAGFALADQNIDITGAQDMRLQAHGGANADNITHNSDIDSTLYNVIGSLTGAAAQIAMQTYNVFDISMEEGNSFWEAVGDATDTASFEVKRRFPQIDVPGLYNARERAYAFTPEAEYVYKTERELDPIIGSGRQLSIERDAKGSGTRQLELGLIPAAKLRDPFLRAVSEHIWNTIGKKGPYKAASEAYTEIRKDLASLEASRYKMPDDKYNKARNIAVRRQQELVRIQSQELQKLEGTLQKGLGRRFVQQYGVPFSFKNLSELVRKDVGG